MALISVPGFVLFADGMSFRFQAGPSLATDWGEVRRQILARPAGKTRDGLLGAGIRALAAADPALAAQALTEWKNAIPFQWACTASTVVTAMWAVDPDAALAFIDREIPPSCQGEIWPPLLGRMSPDQAAARLDLLSHPTSGRLRAAATILLNWTTCDPPAAAAWLDKLGATLSPRQLSAVALPTYFVEFQTGPPKLSFLEGSRLAFEAARHPAARRMFADDWLQAVAKEQPAQLAAATAEVARQLTAADAGELNRQSAMAEINKDPAAWLAALPEEELGQLPPGFLSQAVTSWAARDTPAATRWALARGLTDHAVSGVNRWYSMDPAAALHFVSALPPGETRDRGMVELCGRFSADQDFPTAEKCLAAIGDPKQAAAADVRLKSNRERHSGKR